MVYTKILLDKRRKKDSGIYTVKFRLTFNREQKYYLTGIRMSEIDFEETMKPYPAKNYRNSRVQLDHLELKIKTIIATLEVFSFRLFEEKFYQSKQASKTIYDLYDKIIADKTNEGKISTALNYQCSMNSLKKFEPKLSFVDITPKFLAQYEKHLLSEDKSISTVGIYLRPLRAVLNEAIANNYISKELYPFGRKKYIIPESKNTKRALEKKDFKKIVEYEPPDPYGYEARGKDFWLLSYLLQGINPKDLLLLKKSDIDGDFIKFTRQKTKDTIRKAPIEITAPLLPEAKQIINKWKYDNSDSPFLFGFISTDMSPVDVYKTVQQFVKMVNKHMKKIAEGLDIQKKVTCYTARFQFSKTLIDANVSVEFLRQCLGHQSSHTTIRYIGSFEGIAKYEIAQKHLLNFDS